MTATTEGNPVFERIESEIGSHAVVLFMKGTPIFPQCGFSALVVQVLSHMGVKFKSVDVLNEPDIRDGIKQFSNWPTIPQLYVQNEFVGGADIIREMYENGELTALMGKHGIEVEAA
jgi:monothiol glutaredoxin